MVSKGRQKRSLQSLSRLPINIETWFNELKGESDRACALIAGAAISDGLRDLLEKYFIKLGEADINRLFHDQGASLGDFASRTDVSFALGLISPQERHAANAIRRIRNQFAHTLAQIDFSNELIISELSKVAVDEPFLPAKGKLRFIAISMALYLSLANRRSYLLNKRWSERGVGPVPIYELSKGGYGMPEPK
jgi:mannitol operon repressor